MTDQTQRLEIATVKAEVGSNILNRFSNDAIEADEIPTDSGPIPNLKQVMKVITDKASVSSSIYPTVAAGLAATAEGAIFLVASSEDDEIYAVWKKVGGVAVDTGKRSLSSQAVEEAREAAQASAVASADSAIEAQSAASNAAEEFQAIFDADQAERETEFNAFMASLGYESTYLVYGPGVIVERQTQLIQREGELYRVMNASDIPLNLTGTWSSDSPKLQAVGDAALRSTLASAEGAGHVGFGDGTVADRLTPRVHVRRFGVKGDGLSDDSSALESAILSGGPLEFGSTQIKITRKISVTVLGALDWHSTGAVIFNGASIDIGAMLDITVLPGLDHRITGKMTIDGNLKSFLGLRVWNKSIAGFPLGYANFYSADTEVRNIRRASAAFNDGDGIVVRGGFQSVTFDRPVIKNVLLAAGAGVAGSVGVTGITVFGDATGFPVVTTVNDALIDTVKSEDPAYNSDQDGLRVFGPWFTVGSKTNNVLRVNGGQFRDCWGRSVKSQTDVTVVTGTNFASYSGPTTGRNVEIDLQVGGGVVRNTTHYYSGANSAPSALVVFQPNEGFESFGGVLDGAKVFTTTLLKSVCETFPRARTQHRTTVSNVDVIGPITRMVEFRIWSDKSSLSVKDCTANNIAEGLVRTTSSGLAGSPYVGRVDIENCVNLGTIAALVTDHVSGVSADTVVSDAGCVGFTRQAAFTETTTPKGGITRLPAIAGDDANTGTFRVKSLSLANGSAVEFPGHGYNATAAAVISFGFDMQSHAFISFGAAGVLKLAGGTGITVGTTSDPGTGMFRIWVSGGKLQVYNNAGSTRQCTIFYMG